MLLRADAGSSAAETAVRREMEERQETNRSESASKIFRSASIPASRSHEATHVTSTSSDGTRVRNQLTLKPSRY